MKNKIAFIAHEFGLFYGHGGIAMYLNTLITQILNRFDNYLVYIFTLEYDKKSELLKNERVKLYKIKSDDLHMMGIRILNYLKVIRPNIIECTDYMALGLETLCYRNETLVNELSDTSFITVHHTASRECFEWNNKTSVKYADQFIRECFEREKTQIRLSDLNVAPSNFMCRYIMQNYNLTEVKVILHPLGGDLVKKENLILETLQKYELDIYEDKFIVSCISRIEGRKNQILLVEQFIRFLERTHADALLILVGNSSINSVTGEDYKSEIYESIPLEYIDRVHFFDFMTYKEKRKIYAVSDLVVLASNYECLSFALVEAVLHEIPVITSKYCGFIDYIGETADKMTFNPFKENDLLDKIDCFYNLEECKRKEIANKQYEELIQNANYKDTIDERLKIYKSVDVKHGSQEDNVFVVDPTNYLTTIDDAIIRKKFDSIMVCFSVNLQLADELKRIFSRVSECFEENAVICYAGSCVQMEYINVIESKVPFYIKVNVDFKMIGKRIVDVISYYSNKGILYNLVGDDLELINDVHGKVSDETNLKKEQFRQKLLVDYFYQQNFLMLERKYAE